MNRQMRRHVLTRPSGAVVMKDGAAVSGDKKKGLAAFKAKQKAKF